MIEEFQSKLIDSQEVANLCGLSRNKIDGMRAETPYKGPPFLRIGAAVRYPISGLERWIDQQIAKTSGGKNVA